MKPTAKPIKFYKSIISSAASRKTHKCYLVEGVKNVRDILKKGIVPEEIIIDKKCYSTVKKTIPELNQRGNIRIVESGNFKKIKDVKTSQGVSAVLRIPEIPAFKHGSVIAMDGVQDPGNVGTIIRTALAFGIDQFLIDAKTADPFSGKVIRSSAGSVPFVRIRKCTALADELVELRRHGFLICLLDSRGGRSVEELTGIKKSVLITGSEGSGPTKETKELADLRATIKIKNMDSINAAVACAIAVFCMKA